MQLRDKAKQAYEAQKIAQEQAKQKKIMETKQRLADALQQTLNIGFGEATSLIKNAKVIGDNAHVEIDGVFLRANNNGRLSFFAKAPGKEANWHSFSSLAELGAAMETYTFCNPSDYLLSNGLDYVHRSNLDG